MITLCLSIGHDANACLFKDGKIINFCLAERIDGLKASSNIYSCLDHIFSSSGYCPEDVELVLVTGTQGREFHWTQPLKLRMYANKSISRGYSNEAMYQDILIQIEMNSPSNALKQHFELLKKENGNTIQKEMILERDFHMNPNILAKEYLPLISPSILDYNILSDLSKGKEILGSGKISDLFSQSIDCYLYNKKIQCIWLDHHLCHVLGSIGRGFGREGSFYMSTDGATGSIENICNDPRHSGYLCQRINDEIIFKDWTYFCGGIIYLNARNFLNLQEGKIMGLAPYINQFTKDDIDIIDKNIISLTKLINTSKSTLEVVNILQKVGINDFKGRFWQSVKNNTSNVQLKGALDSRIRESLPSNQKIITSYLIQSIFECLLSKLFKDLNIKKLDNLILSGGCTLNATANRKICNEYSYVNIELDNACNDEGNSIGCAVFSNFILTSKLKPIDNIKDNDIFIGSYPHIPLTLTNEILEDFDFISVKDNIDLDNLIIEKLINKGIGISFRGRYESGPRALGNRSLISTANWKEAHFTLNKIKAREYWRPIAPMIRDVDFNKYFKGHKNMHMIMTNFCISNKIPASKHIDSTSRVQVITKPHSLYKILSNLADNTNTPPILCNTSLNGKNQPIYNDLQQVISMARKHEEIKFIILESGLLIRE